VLAVYSNAVLALRGRLAWAHDWVSDATLTPVFQSLPGASFIVNGALPVKDSALASAGGELRLANGVTQTACTTNNPRSQRTQRSNLVENPRGDKLFG
jgi:uncharacterized protein with beta-barrel porin domain